MYRPSTPLSSSVDHHSRRNYHRHHHSYHNLEQEVDCEVLHMDHHEGKDHSLWLEEVELCYRMAPRIVSVAGMALEEVIFVRNLYRSTRRMEEV